MKFKEKKNVYVQPDCQVIQVKVESIIATSGDSNVSPTNAFGDNTEEEW